ECAFLGVDLRRLQPTLLELVELARKRLDLADEPSEFTPAAGLLGRARGAAGRDRLAGELWGGTGAPGFESDGQGDRGDDAAKDLEGRRQRDVCDDDAGEDGRQREGGVRGDIEGRHDCRAVLMRDRRRQRAKAAEEGGAEAGATEDRAC